MKLVIRSFILLLLCSFTNLHAQYTDVINSNRPGTSMSAYSVGKRVLQLETGFTYKKLEHQNFNQSIVEGYAIDGTLRYGFFKEQLEILWDFTYQFDELTNTTVSPEVISKRSNFLKNTLGIKYLLFDPVSEEDQKINIRSWDANHGFHWRNVVPAISLYAGANFNMSESPYDYFNQYNLQNYAFYAQLEEPQISPKAVLSAQSNFLPFWVLVANFSYNRIATDYPEMGFVVTITHAFSSNPRFSMFVEDQGVKSDVYADNIVKFGFAYLLGKNVQIDLNAGTSIKDTPAQTFGGLGLSFRIDRHRDELKTSKEKANKDLTGGKKKKKKKKKRKKGLEKIEETIEDPQD
ncbi:Putative MetA-pathway of phenol degradation [Pustulibacterium marinum]|uniref:Putative MetA-pathway of phenol degradation n=1 Tax=Pustulibacterium marinum TaxID=1224947 RepID=A0A1I7FUB9_9FLAO|nr:transporter [Pustulibacterium marinum]SFU39758.1 Putative MetA-pathway of phenol degradation [Pustulibacterium marinum]